MVVFPHMQRSASSQVVTIEEFESYQGRGNVDCGNAKVDKLQNGLSENDL
jgi:hypothetical protein